ncbi:hypothetical protein XEUV490_06955 [Xanthomonas euvesicatoria]|uniref:Uncharacterized protein n=1 Tax=Xanthomonas perforans TaxID=442694 RepID=A0ABR5ENZ9_XANPE|nr:hypothetical protein XEUV490_06955 [Xanthomonas euvesicatoria]KLC03381.1 hypothetical protein XP315_17540 [Xanthomonas perforans]KLB87324.1 hypothetical protein XEUV526_03200 [Xanthomonas euvesicatoria]KLB97711.1 hypothetical protein XEUV678_06625 [Xanthomonas euvesicatoria]KLC62907.1 hypothetical protein GEV839_13690 [Xanthomonas perforans]
MKGAGGRQCGAGAAGDWSGARAGQPQGARPVRPVTEPTARLVWAVDVASRALPRRRAGRVAQAFLPGAAARAVATSRRIARRSRG